MTRTNNGLKADGPVLHTLFVEVSALRAATIDIASGQVIANPVVTNFNNWGEMTRPFTYNPAKAEFYYFEADYINTTTNATQRPLFMYTIDAASGEGKKQVVSGAYNLPTAFEYDCANDQLYVATQEQAKDGSVNGYNFYTVDTNTAVASHVSRADASGDNAWAGWFHELGSRGDTTYRLGFEDARTELNFGLGSTDISSATANTTWVDVNAAPEHDNYDTITLHDGLFYSLAQSLTNNSYDLIKWTPVATPSIVTSFTNAHPVKIFGHVLTQCDCHSDQFIAVVVEDHFPGITKDRWTFHLVDLTTGKDQVVETIPEFPANEFSIAGLGLPVTN